MKSQTETPFDKILITKYLKESISLDEEKTLYNWIESSTENAKLFAEIKLMYYRCGDEIEKSTTNQQQIKKSLDDLNQRIDSWTTLKANTKKKLWVKISIAASICLLIGITLLYTQRNDLLINEIPYFTYVNQDSLSEQIVLKDGTKVWLNAGSQLSYTRYFGERHRIVKLRGEAFFDVTPNNLLPFRVRTNTIQILVKGTVFHVKENNLTAETTLVKGAICLEDANGNKLINLKPGQQAIYERDSKELNLNEVSTDRLVYEYELISLKDVSLPEIVRKIEDVYKVELSIEKDYNPNKLYCFNFLETAEIKDVIKILEYISENKIIIKPSKK